MAATGDDGTTHGIMVDIGEDGMTHGTMAAIGEDGILITQDGTEVSDRTGDITTIMEVRDTDMEAILTDTDGMVQDMRHSLTEEYLLNQAEQLSEEA